MIQYNALGTAQSEDLAVVLRLANELTNILQENRIASNELIALADTLDTDDDDETDSESITGVPVSSILVPVSSNSSKTSSNFALSEPSKLMLSNSQESTKDVNNNNNRNNAPGSTEEQEIKSSNKRSRMSSLLSRENESLQSQVAAQRARNRALARLLILTQYTLDKCVAGLRTLVHSHTLESLNIHKKYIDTIHAEQRNSIEMELQNAELESRILQISKALRDALRLTTVPSSTSSKPIRNNILLPKSDNAASATAPTSTSTTQNLHKPLNKENVSEDFPMKTKSSSETEPSLPKASSTSASTSEPRQRNDEFSQKYQSYLPVPSILNNSHIHTVPQDGKTWLETDGDISQMPDYVMGMLESILITSEQLKNSKELLYKDLKPVNENDQEENCMYQQYESGEQMDYGMQYQ